MLTIDGATSFLQLMDVQNVLKMRISVQTGVRGNSNTAQDGRIVTDSEGFILTFLCVRIEMN